jgi:Undecaprenyl-phosphate glucose phosphotransferase
VGTAWLAFAIPLIALSVAGARAAVGGLLRQEAHALGARRAVILGAGPQADRFVATLREQGPGSIRVLGLVDERGPRTVAPPEQVTDLGGLATLGSMIRRNEVDVVIVAVPWSAEARLADLLQRLAPYPVEIRLAPDLLSQELADGPGEPVILRRRPISGWCAVAKRVQDVVLAISALAVAAFPMLLIALAIRLDTPGPVLFRQRRTGFNDKPFDVLKFRTMYDEAADHDVVLQVQAGDPRVTRVGAILRRTSLDELPQLINVLRGEMSFVGPRPHAPGTRAGTRRFDEVVANYAARHRVKPGLTGLAQVRGFRGPTPNEDQVVRRVESDLEYIENWSLRLDAVIILRTLLEVARMRNAC